MKRNPACSDTDAHVTNPAALGEWLSPLGLNPLNLCGGGKTQWTNKYILISLCET